MTSLLLRIGALIAAPVSVLLLFTGQFMAGLLVGIYGLQASTAANVVDIKKTLTSTLSVKEEGVP